MTAPGLRAGWQIAQGLACACRGMDDLCVCQNENPWPAAPAPDWQARAERLKAALKPFAEAWKALRPEDLYYRRWATFRVNTDAILAAHDAMRSLHAERDLAAPNDRGREDPENPLRTKGGGA